MSERKLTVKQEKFLHKYLECGNASEAYRFAYDCSRMKGDSVNDAAKKALQHPLIAPRIEKARAANAEAASYGRKELFQDYVDIATADPNELVQARQECCHFCYGEGHKYQWSTHEFALATEAAQAGKRPLPQLEGGFGYDPKKKPHPECPACHGDGDFRPQIMDSRYLSPAAKKLYRGIKMTASGPQIIMADQDAARQMIGRMVGVFDQKVTVKTDAPPSTPSDLKGLTPTDASKAYNAVMGTE